MSTSPRVSFGLYGIEIKQDSTPSTADSLHPFSKIIDLKTDNVTPLPYATYEPDFWLLDGNWKLLPDDVSSVHVGLMSTEMSDASGEFADPPVLTINFARSHDTDGLSLQFSQITGDYASEIVVEYYSGATLLSSETYEPTSAEWSVEYDVSDFDKIEITFNKTNRAYRYLRLLRINYGQLLTLEGDSIRAASVVEESDPLSAEVRINTFDLRIWSEDEQFSILNPEGYYAALKARQPLAVYETVDNSQVFIGQYYLDTWKNVSENEIEFSCVDMMGILDSIPFRGGLYDGQDLGDLLEEIMEAVFVPYELDPALADVELTGWIPAGSYREALQQIAFAVGASVDCSRSWTVKIYSTQIAEDSTATKTITSAEKSVDQAVTLRQLITGVDVTAHAYVESTETKELYNGTLAAGSHEIIFNQPMHDLGITGGTITESGANYAIVSVASPGTVVLSGQIYTDTTQVKSITTSGLSSSIRPNVLKVEEAYLVHPGNLSEVAQRLYDYHQQRYVQDVKLFAPSITIGNVVEVDTLYSQKIRGVVEKMDADLFGGFVVKASIIGVVES